MELWRRAADPWGQEVLIGISWDLMWAAVIAGLAFAGAHAVWAKWLAPAESASTGGGSGVAGLPAQILRHAMSERVFHWGMSVAMLVLLVTAFLPIMGIQFAWVTIHWVAGVILTLMIAYHMVHATFFQDFWAMWVNGADIKAGMAELSHMVGRNGTEVPKAAKYPIDHKMFHHGAAVSGLAAIVTGIFMMLRLETPFWTANPYLLSETAWGVMYIVHGVSGVALIALVITHIYFAIRPDKWWITKSMIYGFIGRDEYVEHFDPNRWPISGAAPQEEEELVPAGVGAAVGAGEAEAPEAGAPEPEPVDSGAPGDSGESSTDERASEVGGQD
ncbi:MAG: cytochrome b/b6 domain-containing protein [Gemmatimonadetes bacterium]|nr:cytochrome b/b6 domain-containing protein [Gemmatimonadota bacterium]